MNLTLLDFLVIGVPLALVLAVTGFMRRSMRSVADFLAANRCAGRYLICTASAETGSNVVMMITALEIFSRTGFSMGFWNSFTSIVAFLFGLIGLVSYRFRETRALTFHQFFEVRYSKRVRVTASFLNVFSGLFNFGIQPAVGARFFVYFCGLPEYMTVGPMTLRTYIPVMLFLMGASLYFALSGGQISVMVTDCLEGVISSVFYLLIAGFIIFTVSVGEMREALLSGPPGNSFVDPFDIGDRKDFNGWYVVFGLLLSTYFYRGGAWNQGFAAAAKSPHEGRMAQILGNWRAYSYGAMGVLVSLAAFTVMHHADFDSQRAAVENGLQGIGTDQLRTQMQMPMALGVLLAPGVKGAFLAVALFGLLASQGTQLHGYGSTILQDVILPLRKRPFGNKAHVRILRLTLFFVAAFTCAFSILFKPVDYLVMITTLIGAIYLGGIGCVVWGGLYWKRGTAAGAMVALAIGAVLGVGFNLIQQFWPQIAGAWMAGIGPGGLMDYLVANADRCPLNGQQLALITAAAAGLSYIGVSLLTCKEPFDLDRLLHRGAYRVAEVGETEKNPGAPEAKRGWLYRFLAIDKDFTRGDRALTVGTFCWTIAWKILAIGILLWTLFVGRLSPNWWFNYSMITGVWLTIGIAVIVTVWFTIGVTHDIAVMFRTLKTAKRDESDDGMVRD